MTIGRVQTIWRYPVSSLGGESLDEAELDATGVVGDRLWGIVDAETGAIAKPEAEKRWRVTPEVLARLSASEIEVQIPGGDWMRARSDAAEHALADHFGFPVKLKRHGPAFASPDTVEPRYRRSPIHLITSASLEALKSILPDSVIDPRRFRPNLVITLPDDAPGFAEGKWMRREIRIGPVRLYVNEPCDRCAFTMLGQRDIPFDKAVLPAISAMNGKSFGIYCAVLEGGRIAAGDPVEVI
ncbi:MOSC domain-containing protein [Rhodoligotrophos defluvii]|uniref:MOSC domain-containing protein n=1 Tax=Rhodoligotrophos defluvii TaxID=2561934 RepID=UPI0010C9C9A5|nr:MOSC domain-containing protein [Rhodoligotrophos defluvii]